jgi:hypothetical protein
LFAIACNGTIVVDSEMGEVIQLQGDQRKDVQEFLTDKKEGLELDAKTIKVNAVPLQYYGPWLTLSTPGSWFLSTSNAPPAVIARSFDRSVVNTKYFLSTSCPASLLAGSILIVYDLLRHGAFDDTRILSKNALMAWKWSGRKGFSALQ